MAESSPQYRAGILSPRLRMLGKLTAEGEER